jgi:ABC-type glycerol-3-phosphate transport system substrate-binding protein
MLNRLVCRGFLLPLGIAAALSPLAGCPNSPGGGSTTGITPPPAKSQQPLVVIVADDPPLGQAIRREWLARTEEELTVREVSLGDLTSAGRLPGDAVIVPAGYVGTLAERGLILPLDASALDNAEFDHRDIFDQVRLREMKWGNRTVAAPLGSPQLLLAYRPDVFEKLGLSPPADWADYQRLAARLADKDALGDLASAKAGDWHATIEPLAEGWAGQMLLARAAAYAMHRDQVSALFRFDTMDPLIDQPPFVWALEELVAAAQAGGITESRLTPDQAFAALRAGECGMAITWPPSELAAASEADAAPLAFALLPGAKQAYRFGTKKWDPRGEEESPHVPLLAVSGRMAAVVSSTADPRRAQNFVLWLASRDVSQQVGPHSQATTLFRDSQIASSTRWTGSLAAPASRQYAEVLAESLRLPQALQSPSLPGRADYLAALDEAVSAALAGTPAREALTAAARRWQQITEKQGLAPQRRANARNLGQQDL